MLQRQVSTEAREGDGDRGPGVPWSMRVVREDLFEM